MNTVLVGLCTGTLVMTIGALLTFTFLTERTHRRERSNIMRALLARNAPEFAYLERVAPDEDSQPAPVRRLRPHIGQPDDSQSRDLPEGL